MNFRNKCVLVILLLNISNSVLAQFDYNKKLSGLLIKTGLSRAYNENSNPSTYLSASFGVYKYFNVNKKNESIFPFHYLRTELNIGSRSGLFTVNELNQTAIIQTNFIELGLIAPLTWEITNHIAANIGVGGALGFVRGQNIYSDIKPTPTIKEGNSVKGSILIDYHLLFVGSSNGIIGSRIIIEPTQYSYSELSFYIGFAMPKRNKTK